MYKLSGKKIHEYLRYKVVKTGNTVDHNFSRTQNFREFREAISNRENIVLAKDRNSANIFGNQCQHLHPGICIYIFIATYHSASGTC